jgi:hypothetical protein
MDICLFALFVYPTYTHPTNTRMQVTKDIHSCDVGVDLFRRVLTKSEQIQQVFNVDMNDIENMEKNGRMLSHAAVVKVCSCRYTLIIASQNALNDIINHFTALLTVDEASAEQNDAILKRVRMLGARHAQARPKG